MADQGISLGTFFNGRPSEKHPEAWNELWEKHDYTPWDRRGPSMALFDLLAQKSELFSLPTVATRKTALVPGCGRGYDVLLLASFGFDAYGLDASATAVSEARRNAEQATGLEVYKQRGERPGSATWIVSDFFAEQWPCDLGVHDGKFDLIFDYTFFCALPPSLKPAWAKRMVDLLAPGGRLVCLEFPSGAASSRAGPPWASPPHSYLAYLGRPGQVPARDEHGGVLEDCVEGHEKGGLRRVLHERPARTHVAGMKRNEAGEVIEGEVDDYISVWKHQ